MNAEEARSRIKEGRFKEIQRAINDAVDNCESEVVIPKYDNFDDYKKLLTDAGFILKEIKLRNINTGSPLKDTGILIQW